METREELLNGLYYTKDMISKILADQNEQVRIASQYRNEEQGIDTTRLKNCIWIWVAVAVAAVTPFYLVHGVHTGNLYDPILLLFTGGMALRGWKKGKRGKKFWTCLTVISIAITLYSYWWYLSLWLMAIPAGMVTAFVISYAIRKKNAQVAVNNAAINRHNIETRARYDAVTERIQQLIDEMFNRTSAWYPQSYYSLNAVNFFINVVENFRADSVKEMVNLLEATREQENMKRVQDEINRNLQQQTLNQEKINRQLQYANVMNIVSMFQQSNMTAAMNANTQAMMNNTSAVNANNRAVTDNTNAVKKIYDRMF